MRWLERICITWSAAAIAFSLGCAVRGEVGGQAETVFHLACVGFHVMFIAATVAMYRRRTTNHAVAGGEG